MMWSHQFKMSKTLFYYVMLTLQLRFKCIQQFISTYIKTLIVKCNVFVMWHSVTMIRYHDYFIIRHNLCFRHIVCDFQSDC